MLLIVLSVGGVILIALYKLLFTRIFPVIQEDQNNILPLSTETSLSDTDPISKVYTVPIPIPDSPDKTSSQKQQTTSFINNKSNVTTTEKVSLPIDVPDINVVSPPESPKYYQSYTPKASIDEIQIKVTEDSPINIKSTSKVVEITDDTISVESTEEIWTISSDELSEKVSISSPSQTTELPNLTNDNTDEISETLSQLVESRGSPVKDEKVVDVITKKSRETSPVKDSKSASDFDILSKTVRKSRETSPVNSNPSKASENTPLSSYFSSDSTPILCNISNARDDKIAAICSNFNEGIGSTKKSRESSPAEVTEPKAEPVQSRFDLLSSFTSALDDVWTISPDELVSPIKSQTITETSGVNDSIEPLIPAPIKVSGLSSIIDCNETLNEINNTLSRLESRMSRTAEIPAVMEQVLETISEAPLSAAVPSEEIITAINEADSIIKAADIEIKTSEALVVSETQSTPPETTEITDDTKPRIVDFIPKSILTDDNITARSEIVENKAELDIEEPKLVQEIITEISEPISEPVIEVSNIAVNSTAIIETLISPTNSNDIASEPKIVTPEPLLSCSLSQGVLGETSQVEDSEIDAIINSINSALEETIPELSFETILTDNLPTGNSNIADLSDSNTLSEAPPSQISITTTPEIKTSSHSPLIEITDIVEVSNIDSTIEAAKQDSVVSEYISTSLPVENSVIPEIVSEVTQQTQDTVFETEAAEITDNFDKSVISSIENILPLSEPLPVINKTEEVQVEQLVENTTVVNSEIVPEVKSDSIASTDIPTMEPVPVANIDANNSDLGESFEIIDKSEISEIPKPEIETSHQAKILEFSVSADSLLENKIEKAAEELILSVDNKSDNSQNDGPHGVLDTAVVASLVDSVIQEASDIFEKSLQAPEDSQAEIETIEAAKEIDVKKASDETQIKSVDLIVTSNSNSDSLSEQEAPEIKKSDIVEITSDGSVKEVSNEIPEIVDKSNDVIEINTEVDTQQVTPQIEKSEAKPETLEVSAIVSERDVLNSIPEIVEKSIEVSEVSSDSAAEKEKDPEIVKLEAVNVVSNGSVSDVVNSTPEIEKSNNVGEISKDSATEQVTPAEKDSEIKREIVEVKDTEVSNSISEVFQKSNNISEISSDSATEKEIEILKPVAENVVSNGSASDVSNSIPEIIEKSSEIKEISTEIDVSTFDLSVGNGVSNGSSKPLVTEVIENKTVVLEKVADLSANLVDESISFKLDSASEQEVSASVKPEVVDFTSNDKNAASSLSNLASNTVSNGDNIKLSTESDSIESNGVTDKLKVDFDTCVVDTLTKANGELNGNQNGIQENKESPVAVADSVPELLSENNEKSTEVLASPNLSQI